MNRHAISLLKHLLAVALALAVSFTFLTPPATAAPACTIVGTNGDDILTGTEGPDVICGRNGNDTIHGLGGDDTLLGENGSDTIYAGDGNDVAYGGNGNDTIYGDAGHDELFGENGADVISGGDGADTLGGGNDGDSLFGGAADDRLLGERGTDLLVGDGGSDALSGGQGTDECVDDAASFDSCETQTTPPPAGTPGDADSDGFPDQLEALVGSDPFRADTDGDGLKDADEFTTLTEPSVSDSDGDGLPDGMEDLDGDGLTNAEEIALGSRPGNPDGDGDGLADGEEHSLGTSLLLADSDGDGLNDRIETELGFNPLLESSRPDGIVDSARPVTTTFSGHATPASLEITVPAAQLHEVAIDASQDVSLNIIPGLVAAPIDVRAPQGALGTITIPFDPSSVPSGANLAVLHFDDEAGTVDIPGLQSIDLGAGLASVTTSDFSPFALVDLDAFTAGWVAPPPDLSGQLPSDVVVIVDSSYGMRTSDPEWSRIDIARDLILNHLTDADRVALTGTTMGLLAPLSYDRDAVATGLYSIFAYYNNDLTYSLNQAISHLNANTLPNRRKVVILISNGVGGYQSSVITTARNSNVAIYTVAVGDDANTTRLETIAYVTRGGFALSWDSADLGDMFADLHPVDGAPRDYDRDGLPDAVETGGIRSYTGVVYHTSPCNADTDRDGLSDGFEAGEITSSPDFGYGLAYHVRSNPAYSDSDSDRVADDVELANFMYVFDADYDRDGIGDSDEWDYYGTDPIVSDSDGDGFRDDFEIANIDRGFDPTLPDVNFTWYEYAGDFARGALCGDFTFSGFCDPISLAFLTGQIASGVAMVGDVRDVLAGIFNGDPVGTGLSAFGLIPLLGDSAKFVDASANFLKRFDANPAAALRWLGRADNVPAGVRIQALDQAFDGAATALKDRGLDEQTILNFARRGMSPKHVQNMLDAAADVKRGYGKFFRESDAEALLHAQADGADAYKFGVRNSNDELRIYDVTSTQNAVGNEVKFGKVPFAGRARVQATRDASLVSNPPEDSLVTSVRWHFFADRNGVFGPDPQLLDLLLEKGIPFTIYMP